MSPSDRITYNATVISNGLAVSSQKNTKSIKISVRVDTCLSDPQNHDFDGKILVGDLWLTYGSIKNTLRTLLNVFDISNPSIHDFNDPILSGKKCSIVTEIENYEGNDRVKIVFFNPAKGECKKLSDQELMDLFGPEVENLIQTGLEELKKDSPSPLYNNSDKPLPF